MKKLLTTLLATIAAILPMSAQDIAVDRFEYGAYVGVTYPQWAAYNAKSAANFCAGLEARYNLDGPADVGLLVGYTSTTHKYTNASDFNVDGFKIQAVCDGNFRKGKTVSPFVGAGLGVMIYDSYGNKRSEPASGSDAASGAAVIFSPRIGVELFYHARVTLTANFYKLKRLYDNIELTVGFTLGGKPRKVKSEE